MEPALRMTPEQVEQIDRADGGVCEWCAEQVDSSLLRIHYIRYLHGKDQLRYLLILCPRCYHLLHRCRVPQAAVANITNRRPYHTRSTIRRILGIQLPSYQAPDTPDLAELYRDACSSWCLNGSG